MMSKFEALAERQQAIEQEQQKLRQEWERNYPIIFSRKHEKAGESS
ncbi:hypothetical protein HPC63_15875 [Treponema phagedenis]|nr:hypothetical protein [Treponema phagedenis]